MFRASVAVTVLGLGLVPIAAAPPAAPQVDPNPKSLEVSAEDLSKARELVQKLGSERYREREEAERALAEMGRLARAALLDAVNLDPDPEIRHRAAFLLPKANADEMQARLAVFLADTKGEYEHDLPGWHQLRAVVRGETTLFGWSHVARPHLEKAARELFIELMQTPAARPLLVALERPAAELGPLIAARKQEIYNAMYPRRSGLAPRNPTPAEMTAVLLAEACVHSRYIPRSMVITNFLTQSGIPGVIQGANDRAQAIKAVLTAWIETRSEVAEITTALTIAGNILRDPDVAGRLAIRILQTPGLTGFQKSTAIANLVQSGAKQHLPLLEKAMTDTTVVTTMVRVVNGQQIRETIEVRDVALAGAILLSGQDPVDYGFEKIAGAAGAFNYSRARIASDKRQAALEKWQQWREKNP
jgi:hypothetical protein